MDELIKAVEMLKKAHDKEHFSVSITTDTKNEFKVFISRPFALPEGGAPEYQYNDRIKMWFKRVIINGIVYENLLTEEEYRREVA